MDSVPYPDGRRPRGRLDPGRPGDHDRQLHRWRPELHLTRFVAGTGIGGEYAAINSAIDELIPARYRGRVDIAVNGTYWAGAIIGTLVTSLLPNELAPGLGWRLGFLLGPVLAVVIIFIRRNLPESPRLLLMHGRPAEAEEAIRASRRADCSHMLPDQPVHSPHIA
jgi:MFS family permease